MDILGAHPIIAAAGAPVRIPPPGGAGILDLEGSHHDYCPHSYRCHHVFRAGAERLPEEGRNAAGRRPAAADAAAPAATAAATDPNAANVPAECNAYLDHVAACSAKLAQANPMAAEQMRKSAEQTRASWAAIDNQTALAAACKQVDEGFAASATAMGC